MIPSKLLSERKEKKKHSTSPREEQKIINPIFLAQLRLKSSDSDSPPSTKSSTTLPLLNNTAQSNSNEKKETSSQGSLSSRSGEETNYALSHTFSSPAFFEAADIQQKPIGGSLRGVAGAMDGEILSHSQESKLPKVVFTLDNNLKEFLKKETSMAFKRGLHHSFEFDYETRLLFMNKLQRSSEEKEKVALNPLYGSRVSLYKSITRKGCELLSELGKLLDMMHYEEVVQSLLAIAPLYSATSKFLRWAVHTELENTNEFNSLFRSSSLSTQLLSSYCQKFGKSYLQEIIKPFVLEVVALNSSMELDDNKLNKNDKREQNLALFLQSCQKLVSVICNSISSFPRSIRVLLKYIKDRQLEKFPNSEPHIALGAFAFLRFICPALVSPDGYRLISESPSIQTRRNLILISKALQNLGNRTDFGSKEDYMAPVNPFIASSQPAIAHFFTSLVDVEETDLIDDGIVSASEYDLFHDPFECLDYHLRVNQDQLQKCLTQRLFKPNKSGEGRKPRTELVHSLHQELKLAALNRDLAYGGESDSSRDLLRISVVGSIGRARTRSSQFSAASLFTHPEPVPSRFSQEASTLDEPVNLQNDQLIIQELDQQLLEVAHKQEVAMLQAEVELLRTKLDAEREAKVHLTRKYRQTQKLLQVSEQENMRLKLQLLEFARSQTLSDRSNGSVNLP